MGKKQPSAFLKVYFDCETYEQTVPGHELPIIIPYAIGACTSEPNSYVSFIGLDATNQFLNWLLDISKNKVVTLMAFNIDYDFWAIYPVIREQFKDLKVRYVQTAERKYIGGTIKSKGIRITFRDLWAWDKDMSLAKWGDEIESARKDYPDKWNARFDSYGITEAKKGSIDYKKTDIFQDTFKDFWYKNEDGVLTKLDLVAEQEYLRQDVLMLPLIDAYISDFKQLCLDTLELKTSGKDILVNSIPALGKRLAELFLSESLEEGYRCDVPLEMYKDMDNSYFGGFSSLNSQQTRIMLDTPEVVSLDVNSMYPAIMEEGIPYGFPYPTKPEGKYCTWYCIHFEKEIEPGKLYRWKPEYSFFNNDFFGKYYFKSHTPSVSNKKVYILDKVLDLFEEMCDSHLVVNSALYQPIKKDLSPFINRLYEIKSNKDKYSKTCRTAIKKVMNSLYGKFAERFHTEYYELTHKLVVPEKKYHTTTERSNILSGLYITSMARVRLLKAVQTEVKNGNVVLACDTDSIKIIRHNKPKVPQHESKLGYWKNEGEFTHFIHPNKCKKYLQYNTHTKAIKFASAGLNRPVVRSLSEEDLFKLFDKDNNVLFKEIKNASKRNDWGQVVIRKIDVQFNPIDKKLDPTHIYDSGKIIPYGT